MMKRAISIILLAVMLFSMYSCGTPDDTTASPETKSPEYILKPSKEHTLYLYSNSKGIPADTKTPRYEGVKFDSISFETYKKEDINPKVPLKTEHVFDGEYEIYYDTSRKYGTKEYIHCVGVKPNDDDSLYLFLYDCDTGKIVQYSNLKESINRNYSSPVNPSSTEAEFIAYAKQILIDIFGKSTEGYAVSVRTNLDGQNEYAKKWVDGFVSDPEEKEDPLDNVCYEFTFSQAIDGIECYDKMTVYVTNVGEPIKVDSMADAAKYEPFKDLKIDREQLERTMLQRAPSVTNASYVERYISELVLVAQGNELWAKGAVTQRWQAEGGMNLSGMTGYVVKLAEYEIAE